MLRDSGIVSEAVILSTCNRVELYAVTAMEPRQAFPALQEFLVKCHDYRDPLTDELYTFERTAQPRTSVQSRLRPRFHGARRN